MPIVIPTPPQFVLGSFENVVSELSNAKLIGDASEKSLFIKPQFLTPFVMFGNQYFPFKLIKNVGRSLPKTPPLSMGAHLLPLWFGGSRGVNLFRH